MKKKITVLLAMLALMMFSAVPAFAQTIIVDEGDVTLENSTTFSDSIGQFGGASVEFGDENVNEQFVENSQNVDLSVTGDGNEVSIDQSIEQSAFSPEVSTELDQAVAQAFWVFVPFWGWVFVF